MYQAKARRRVKPPIDKELTGWPKGYISIGAEGGIPEDALADLTNSDLTRTHLPHPRASLTPYGVQYTGTCIGRGTFDKTVSGGVQEHWEISMQVIGGVSKICVRKDGNAWTQVSGSYSFSTTARPIFTHCNSRVVITNASDNFSYYDIDLGTVVTYVQISPPSTPTVTPTGLTGTTYRYYYAVTAYNAAGETNPAASGTSQVTKLRESWNGTSEYIDISWSAVTGATGYYVYVGTAAGEERFLAEVVGATSFRDDGSIVTAISKTPPLTNATKGPTLTYGVNILGQFFGWGDIDNPSYVWYDGGGEGKSGAGNFTISGGGGYVAVDDGGPSVPVSVVSFRTGKGDPTPSVWCRGAGTSGGFRHISFTAQTVGDLTALMPTISEANGNVGAVSPLGVVAAGDSVHAPTADGFAYEGSAPNIANILSSNRSSDFILTDCQKRNLAVANKWVGHYHEGRIYWAVSVISETNNQIWVLDLTTTPARWIMPWIIDADDIWTYEDNSGKQHLCVLSNNKQLEFTDTIFTTDDGSPFRTRVATGPIRWDKGGISMGYIQKQRSRFLNPRGHVDVYVFGEGASDDVEEMDSLDYPTNAPVTAWGQFDWGYNQWGEDPGATAVAIPDSKTLPIEIKQKVSELRLEVITDTAGADYTLAATHTEGIQIPKLYAGD